MKWNIIMPKFVQTIEEHNDKVHYYDPEYGDMESDISDFKTWLTDSLEDITPDDITKMFVGKEDENSGSMKPIKVDQLMTINNEVDVSYDKNNQTNKHARRFLIWYWGMLSDYAFNFKRYPDMVEKLTGENKAGIDQEVFSLQDPVTGFLLIYIDVISINILLFYLKFYISVHEFR